MCFLSLLTYSVSVHGKKKCAAGHMDQLLRKAPGPQQKLPVHSYIVAGDDSPQHRPKYPTIAQTIKLTPSMTI